MFLKPPALNPGEVQWGDLSEDLRVSQLVWIPPPVSLEKELEDQEVKTNLTYDCINRITFSIIITFVFFIFNYSSC